MITAIGLLWLGLSLGIVAESEKSKVRVVGLVAALGVSILLIAFYWPGTCS